MVGGGRPRRGARRRTGWGAGVLVLTVLVGAVDGGARAQGDPRELKVTRFPDVEREVASEGQTLFVEIALWQGEPVRGRAMRVVSGPAPLTFSAPPMYVARLIDHTGKAVAAVSIWDPALAVESHQIAAAAAAQRTFRRVVKTDGHAMLALPYFPSVVRVDLHKAQSDTPVISIEIDDATLRDCQQSADGDACGRR